MTPWPTQKYSFVAMLQDDINAGGSPMYGMVAREIDLVIKPATLTSPRKPAQPIVYCGCCEDRGVKIRLEYTAYDEAYDTEYPCPYCDGGKSNPNHKDYCPPKRDSAEFRPFSEAPEKDGVYEVKAAHVKGEYFSKYENGIWYGNDTSIKGAAEREQRTAAISRGSVTGWREIQEQK